MHIIIDQIEVLSVFQLMSIYINLNELGCCILLVQFIIIILIQRMGNQQIKEIHNNNQWQVISKCQDYDIIKNKISQLEFQQYRKIYYDHKVFLIQKQMYEARKQEMVDNVVKVENIRYVIRKQMCSSFYEIISYYQNLPFTLEKVENIQFQYSLYLFLQVLSGMNYLLKLYPNFVIDENKIFFNKTGKIKIWINSNISQNEITESNLFDEEEIQTENDQIQRVFDIIESRTLPDNIPLDFIKPVRMNEYTIDQAISHIKRYCFQKKIKIPDSMEKFLWKNNNLNRRNEKKFTITRTHVPVFRERNADYQKNSRIKVNSKDQSSTLTNSVISEIRKQNQSKEMYTNPISKAKNYNMFYK